MKTTIWPYRAQDLGRILRLWEDPTSLLAGDGLTLDQAVDLIGADSSVTLVAEAETDAGDVVGVAVGEQAAVVGWICKLAVSPVVEEHRADVIQELLDDLERELADRDARKLAVLVAGDDESRPALEGRGYQEAEDLVYEIASVRHAHRKVGPSVTNEFLKQIPRLRHSSSHLLICATNAVGDLDPAVLRPGRFGYVLPVGPPDEEARRAIWERFVGDITDEEVDLDELVAASERFTPADIEFAARKAAQVAFEREHFENVSHRATIDDFLTAIRATRPTVTEEMVESFRGDAERFTRQ